MTGIYLMHSGYCLPEDTVISDIALIADNPLHCILAGSTGTGGGQWTGPANTSVQCGGSASSQFTCSQSSDPTSITLYRNTGASFSGKQPFTCTISGQSITVQIESESTQQFHTHATLNQILSHRQHSSSSHLHKAPG